MNSNQQNSNIIFFLCLVTGFLSLFLLPVSEVETWCLPNQTEVHQGDTVISYVRGSEYVPVRYLVCSIDDDPDGLNNFGTYHPTDLAVTVDNLKRLGVKHLFMGTHLHWPALNPKENSSLKTYLETLDSCVISVPLRRTAAEVELPEYLEKFSLPLSAVTGNVKSLPHVNNLSLEPTIGIPNNAVVGFSQLESEPFTHRIPLLAVWADRVLLSSLLLERLHHLGVTPAELKITVGKDIVIGDSGNMLQIDEFGYFTPLHYPNEREPDILSPEITNFKKSPVQTDSSILTAKGLEADSYRAIDQPVMHLDQLTLSPVVSERKVYYKTPMLANILCLVAIAYLLGAAYFLDSKKYILWLILLVALWAGIALTVARFSASYLFLSPIAVAILTALVFYIFLKRREISEEEDPESYVDFGAIANSYAELKIKRAEIKTASKMRRKDRRRKKRDARKAKKQESSSNSPETGDLFDAVKTKKSSKSFTKK